MYFFALKTLAFCLLLCGICLNTIAQQLITPKAYPKNAFANPMKIPISLAGNFGECRPNHFHSGLDVRTNKVENLPVHSIANGYISRVKIEAGGFGNAIYITHQGGFTSLYAHLNDFYPELENHIRSKQYEAKSWKIDLTFQPHQFPVRQGMFIAKSGNTGSSQAPHLHMEIRDTKTEKPLNGLLFYNLPDSKAPLIKKLAVYDVNKSIYDQSPKQLNCTAGGGFYKPGTDTITVATNAVAFGIVADDPMENALGVLGVFEADVYVDDQPYFAWQLDNIGYEETRYMNSQADYKVKKNGGPWIQLCFKLPGDKLSIYKNFSNGKDGKITLPDTRAHKIRIAVFDVKGNKSTLQFWVKSTQSERQLKTYDFDAGKSKTYQSDNIAFTLAGQHVYDGVPLRVSTSDEAAPYSYKYMVHSSDVPVHDYFDLKLRPKSTVPAQVQSKVAMVRLPYGKDTDRKGKAAQMQNGWAVAKVRDFGTYVLAIDQNPPLISGGPTAVLTSKKIVVTCKEDITSVANFVATIDGNWVRFQQKGNTFIYEVDKYCPAGQHVLEIKVSDENGNLSQKSWQFQR
ncbi:MAG: hypothetical protein RL660_1990 [Bacteroidota bacterium]|jgi:hypothetical protein